MNKKSSLINASVMSFPVVIDLPFAFALTHPRESWLFLLLSSLVLISIAKVSQFKKGRWVTFGRKGLDRPYVYFYTLGWFLLMIAVLMTVLMKLN